MRLAPTAGPPGTVVRVTGYRPGGPTAAEAAKNVGLGYATLCWGPCTTSLTFDVQVQWSATHAGDFATSFTVPKVPWLTLQGPHPVTAGRYTVGLQCLSPVRGGCATRGPDASAAFTLRGPTPTTCLPGHACAHIHITPSSGAPGDVVHVSGWAPLTPVIGQPFGYELYLQGLPTQAGGGGAVMLGQARQAADGALSGSLRLPAGVYGLGAIPAGRYVVDLRYLFDGAVTLRGPLTASAKGSSVARATVRLAPTPLLLRAAPTWAALGRLRPLAIARNSALMAEDALHPARQAYCAPSGGVVLSADGGATWSAVPTTGVAAALQGTPYALFGPSSGPVGPVCTGIALDPAHPGSIYATFSGAMAKYGAPPIFTLALWTANAGKSWHAVPPPRGYSLGDFGGFQTQGGSVLALFARSTASGGQGEVWTTERAAGGGTAWPAATLACPSAGPCLRWGPAPNGLGSCAMNGAPQPLLQSAAGGRRWSTVPGVAPNACNLVELVAFGPREAALISGSSLSGYALRLSTDGGATWRDVALPPLPGQGTQVPQQDAGLQMLPDGSLWTIATLPQGKGFTQRALLLAPGARAWCAASAAATANSDPNAAQVLAGRLWSFVTGNTLVDGRPATPASASTPLSRLHCAD